MENVLAGVRVLDLSRYIAGPMAATMLGDMGAEVIRIEPPGGAEDRLQGPLTPSGDNLRYLVLARNKKGITLDLGSPQGQDLFRRLLEISDIVVENYSPPVKEKLGVTYEALRKLKPDIILVSNSAFGSAGPAARRLGFDHIAQAESSAMLLNGFPDSPPLRAQVGWVDMSTALYGALGATWALMHRNRTGQGQWVETALLDTAVSYVSFQGVAAEYQVLGLSRPRLGNGGYFNFADAFEAKDGVVMIVLISDPLWRRLATLVGRPELADDPRFAGDIARYENREVITELVQQWVAARSVDEVIAAMEQARIPCGRVKNIQQVLSDPQVQARELFQPLDVPQVGSVIHPRMAIRMSQTQPEIRTPAPSVGEHNLDVYCGLLGLSEQDVFSLRAEGVV